MTTISPISYTPSIPQRVESTSRRDLDPTAGSAMAVSGVAQRELSESGKSNETVNSVNDLSSQILLSRMTAQTIQTYVTSATQASNDTDASEAGSSDVDINVVRMPDPTQPPPSKPPVSVTPYGCSVSDRMASAYNAAGSPTPSKQRFEAYA